MALLKLEIDVPDGVDEQEVIDYLNIVALCKLEEDFHEITGWKWIRHGDEKKRLVMAFREKQLDILYGPTDLVVEVRDYDHDLPLKDTRVMTDISGSTFRAFIFRADKEMEIVSE
jgi:hypothetical protein